MAVSEGGETVTYRSDHARATVPVPFRADRDDISGVLRVYVGMVWMDAVEIVSVRVDAGLRNVPIRCRWRECVSTTAEARRL